MLLSVRDRDKWNAKYLAQPAQPAQPDQPVPGWLAQHIDALPRGKALDVATGEGRVAIELASCGWRVHAVDISMVALQSAASRAARRRVIVQWVAADLDRYPLPRSYYDLVTVFYFLNRERIRDALVPALRPGGALVVETFTTQSRVAPVRNPSYILEPGELIDLCRGLKVRAYREVRHPEHAIASIVALSDAT